MGRHPAEHVAPVSANGRKEHHDCPPGTHIDWQWQYTKAQHFGQVLYNQALSFFSVCLKTKKSPPERQHGDMPDHPVQAAARSDAASLLLADPVLLHAAMRAKQLPQLLLNALEIEHKQLGGAEQRHPDLPVAVENKIWLLKLSFKAVDGARF